MKNLFLILIFISSSLFCGHQMEIVFKDEIISAYVNGKTFVYENKPYRLRLFNALERFLVISKLKESVDIFMVGFQVVEIPKGKICFFCKEVQTDGNAEIGMAIGKACFIQYQENQMKVKEGKFTMIKFNSFNSIKPQK